MTLLSNKKQQRKKMQYPPPLSIGDRFQDPQWMSATMDSIEPYIYYIFVKYSSLKFNLHIRQSKRLTTILNTTIITIH